MNRQGLLLGPRGTGSQGGSEMDLSLTKVKVLHHFLFYHALKFFSQQGQGRNKIVEIKVDVDLREKGAA